MAWRFSQSSGALANDEGLIIGMGYSGHGAGLFNPGMQMIPDVGPIPEGLWTIGPAQTEPVMGPLVMALTPDPMTDTFSRTGFYLHGDNSSLDHSASCGCIVASRDIRQQLAVSTDRRLQVVP